MRKHTGEKPFACPHCEKKFATKSSLVKHIHTHTGEYCFTCPHCPRRFIWKEGLVAHVRTHTGERPYACTYCSSTFAHLPVFKRHVRTHTGEKPYQCPHCPRGFAAKFSLDTHIRTHTGERPFSCPHCPHKFISKSGLNRHVTRHHAFDKWKEQHFNEGWYRNCLSKFKNLWCFSTLLNSRFGFRSFSALAALITLFIRLISYCPTRCKLRTHLDNIDNSKKTKKIMYTFYLFFLSISVFRKIPFLARICVSWILFFFLYVRTSEWHISYILKIPVLCNFFVELTWKYFGISNKRFQRLNVSTTY